ncbi:class I SAM-dependent methyltransferase [Persicimonas caeni]|uniref:Class I SAM-dependent methyltransferase n=1 Tax=Persicimonas caeni TaxID=2292766 RepID=A0A4Y6PS37_PERCE|nr:class I SAM-dependent methyltransferase [Persicimonas caeni]QDG51146.1 class I SAM-dependent methyltransferase [Persicimonas caeni]QED32367.1 class I SAM-dependent methyltransferase [Persicimonas caeni]
MSPNSQRPLAEAVFEGFQRTSAAELFVRCEHRSPRLDAPRLTEQLSADYGVEAVADPAELPRAARADDSQPRVFAVAPEVMDAPVFGQLLAQRCDGRRPLLLAADSSMEASQMAATLGPLSLRRLWCRDLSEAPDDTVRFVAGEPKPARQIVRETPLQQQTRDQLMAFFSRPIRRMPLQKLSDMRPLEFLAYLGDPNAAPGGGSSVQRLSQRLLDLGLAPDSRILDVGCFTGLSSMVLGRNFDHVLGIDNDAEFISMANLLAGQQESAATFARFDVTDLPFDDNSYDGFVLTATLGYSPEPERIIEEGRRVLRRGGYMVEFLYDYRDVPAHLVRTLQESISAHIRVASLAEQLRLFEQRGLNLVSAERLPSLEAHTDDVENLVTSIVERERQRNFHIYTKHDWAGFEELVRTRACPIDLGEKRPSVYLCIFQKP